MYEDLKQNYDQVREDHLKHFSPCYIVLYPDAHYSILLLKYISSDWLYCNNLRFFMFLRNLKNLNLDFRDF